jgi:hypothetical protein
MLEAFTMFIEELLSHAKAGCVAAPESPSEWLRFRKVAHTAFELLDGCQNGNAGDRLHKLYTQYMNATLPCRANEPLTPLQRFCIIDSLEELRVGIFAIESRIDFTSAKPDPPDTNGFWIDLTTFTVHQKDGQKIQFHNSILFRILAHLYINRDRPVSFVSLRKKVWGQQKLEIGTIYQSIARTRRLLRDNGIEEVQIISPASGFYMLKMSDNDQTIINDL